MVVAVARCDVGGEEIAYLGVPSGRHDLPVRRQQAPLLIGDFVVREDVHGAIQLQALVIGEVERGANLDLEFVDERAVLGQLDLGGIDVGGRERGDVVVLAQLLQAGHHDLALDLIGDFLLVAALDHLARRLAGAEAGDVGVRDQLAELVVQPALDHDAIDGDLDVLLARPDVLDLNLLGQLGRLGFLGGRRG